MKGHSVMKGRRESYALLGAKPSGTYQRRVSRCRINRMCTSGGSQRNSQQSQAGSWEVNQIHTEGEVRAGNKGYRCDKASVNDSSNQPELTEIESHHDQVSVLSVNRH